MQMRTKQAGITLVEIVIVVAILIIVSAIAIPSYQQMIQNSRIKTAAESILSGLQIARAEAVKRNANVQFNFRTGSGWTVCLSPATPGNCPTTDDATTIQSRSGAETSAVTVTVAPASTTGPYVFNSFGMMTSPASSVAFNVVDNAAAGSRDLRVIVGTGGTVKSCDPDAGLAADDPRKCP